MSVCKLSLLFGTKNIIIVCVEIYTKPVFYTQEKVHENLFWNVWTFTDILPKTNISEYYGVLFQEVIFFYKGIKLWYSFIYYTELLIQFWIQ